AWEKCKLGEVAETYSGGTPNAREKKYYGGEIPFIRSAEVNSEKTELFLTEIGFKNSSAKMVNIGDILYALYGATSGEVGISRIKGAINQAILAINPKTGYDNQFIVSWLEGNKETIISTYLQGGQGNLSGTIVKNFEIPFPTLPEQQKIGALFRRLDRLITLHKRQHEHYQLLKKALLQQMFV
ncbi:restriction endonuclease subunit S, partial [Avibacterium paragallinarum]